MNTVDEGTAEIVPKSLETLANETISRLTQKVEADIRTLLANCKEYLDASCAMKASRERYCVVGTCVVKSSDEELELQMGCLEDDRLTAILVYDGGIDEDFLPNYNIFEDNGVVRIKILQRSHKERILSAGDFAKRLAAIRCGVEENDAGVENFLSTLSKDQGIVTTNLVYMTQELNKLMAMGNDVETVKR